jgi:hypothetical protein
MLAMAASSLAKLTKALLAWAVTAVLSCFSCKFSQLLRAEQQLSAAEQHCMFPDGGLY